MFTEMEAKEVMSELQEIFGEAVVLLGGSYHFGEARASSDVDFYALCSWHDFFTYKKYLPAARKVKERHQSIPINVVILPRAAYERGWFYLLGKDGNGRNYRSKFNGKIIFRNSLKLALYDYVLFLTADNERERQNFLGKMAANYAAAKMAAESVGHDAFSYHLSDMIKFFENKPEAMPIIKVLTAKQSEIILSAEEQNNCAQKMFELCRKLTEKRTDWLKFSWFNYLMYNFKFLRHGRGLFLFHNPDKMIIQKLVKRLSARERLPELKEEMKGIVFPIVII